MLQDYTQDKDVCGNEWKDFVEANACEQLHLWVAYICMQSFTFYIIPMEHQEV